MVFFTCLHELIVFYLLKQNKSVTLLHRGYQTMWHFGWVSTSKFTGLHWGKKSNWMVQELVLISKRIFPAPLNRRRRHFFYKILFQIHFPLYHSILNWMKLTTIREEHQLERYWIFFTFRLSGSTVPRGLKSRFWSIFGFEDTMRHSFCPTSDHTPILYFSILGNPDQQNSRQ